MPCRRPAIAPHVAFDCTLLLSPPHSLPRFSANAGPLAAYPLLGDYRHVENHAVCNGKLQADWKAGLVPITIRRFAMCDVAVLTADNQLVAAASGPVDFGAVGRLAGIPFLPFSLHVHRLSASHSPPPPLSLRQATTRTVKERRIPSALLTQPWNCAAR